MDNIVRKKYELTDEKIEFLGRTLYRIRALITFGDVVAGTLGGFVETEGNLDPVSGNAWVYGNAQVYGNAWVSGDAQVYGNAQVSGDAWVYGNARVSGDAWVYGNARVSGNAWVYGNARVSGNAWVYGNARVSGNAQVYGPNHTIVSPLIGSRLSTTTIYKTTDNWAVVCGCFTGSLSEFEQTVNKTHKDNIYGKQYHAFIQMAKTLIEISEQND